MSMRGKMSDVLDEINAYKREHIEACKEKRPLLDVQKAALAASPPRGFINALKNTVKGGRYGLIAEIKKASPSKGLIRPDFNPPEIARAYEDGGATCLSVLTDVQYFQGSDFYLAQARAEVSLPVLRKDFMLDPYQIIESRAMGADCILLIQASLSETQAAELEHVAHTLGMDVLVEVHNAAELESALKLKTELIGVNNRNLKTMEIDIAMTEQLADMIPDDRMLVSESGLFTREDLDRMAKVGANCFLIGESLMRQDDVEAATRKLLGA